LSAALVGCTSAVSGRPVPGQDDDGADPGFGRTTVFDEEALESAYGVAKILVEFYDYTWAAIEDVDCPADQEVKPGSTFTCALTLGGEDHTVTITVVNEDGEYEVSVPEPA
jgi:hypothetical protein